MADKIDRSFEARMEAAHRETLRQMGQMDWNNELYYATTAANRERDEERAARMQAEIALAEANRRIAELEKKQ